MIQTNSYSDERLDGACSYCGEKPDTRDHVPARVLLDDPFPTNLMHVPACERCNIGGSGDEEYFACLIECVLAGTTDLEKIGREKIKKILAARPALKKRIEDAKELVDERIQFRIEDERIRNVLLKLARGHAKYECSEAQLGEPQHFGIGLLHEMSASERDEFLSNVKSDVHEATGYPELGSRAMQKIFFDGTLASPWTTVQEGNYKYCVSFGEWNPLVSFVVRDYLAVEIGWKSD